MNTKREQRFENTSTSHTFQHIVAAFDLDKKSVLDIGCSLGQFLVHFGKHSAGISISQDEVAYGKQKGLDIRYGNIESDDFVLEEKFDVIFCNNLFEHLYSPHQFLFRARTYLKPNGILILGVPCIPKVVSLLRLRKFRGSLAVAHINFFTRDTLIKTVERGGWKVISARGFHFKSRIFDAVCRPLYPHFYVAAAPIPDFHYSGKRMQELVGYTDVET